MLQLCIEVELRFGSKITELENKLAAVVRVFSENEERECTLVDVMKHIQGNVGHSLICEVGGHALLNTLLLKSSYRCVNRVRCETEKPSSKYLHL